MNKIILAPCDVISKIKQNSSDMNKIILAPCNIISKIKLNSSDMNVCICMYVCISLKMML
jgi:hypothetical protein